MRRNIRVRVDVAVQGGNALAAGGRAGREHCIGAIPPASLDDVFRRPFLTHLFAATLTGCSPAGAAAGSAELSFLRPKKRLRAMRQ